MFPPFVPKHKPLEITARIFTRIPSYQPSMEAWKETQLEVYGKLVGNVSPEHACTCRTDKPKTLLDGQRHKIFNHWPHPSLIHQQTFGENDVKLLYLSFLMTVQNIT